MPALRLMADYDCYPLWEGEGQRNVDPFTLPIPIALAEALTAWAGRYTETLNEADPDTSGFPDVSAAETWLRAGADLADSPRQVGFQIDYVHLGNSPRDLVAKPR